MLLLARSSLAPVRLLLCLASLAAAPYAAATEWFVSTTGSDSSGTGSFAQPFRSVAHVLDPALDIAQPGDTVSLRGPQGNNVYNETEVRLRVPLTLRSHIGESAVIQCPLDLEDGVCVQIDPEASGSRIQRLEIRGGNLYGIFLQTNWDAVAAPNETGAANVLIEDSIIHDTGRDGIKLTPKSNNAIIRRCEIYNTGRIYPPGTPLDDKNAEGIDNVNASGMLVEDSYLHDTATSCLYFKGGAADVIVQRNRIERCGVGGILVGFDTSPEFFDTRLNPGYYEAVRGIVRNNIVRDTAFAGIGLFAAQDALVANNTLVHTATEGHAALYFGVTLQDFEPEAGRPPSINPLIRNNLVIQNGGDCARVRWANELGGLSGLTGNPGTDTNWYFNESGACNFADNRPGNPLADGGSFAQWQAVQGVDAHSKTGVISVLANGRLPAGSPAIGQGIALSQVSDDIDREPRSPPYDIGADQVRVATANYAGHWHKPSESGWGLTIAHQGEVLFPNWFTFDSDGKALWFGMLAGARMSAPGVFSGMIFRTRGTPFNLINGQQAFDTVNMVGQGTLTFTAADRLRFDYTIGAISMSKMLEPLVFRQAITCTAAPNSDLNTARNYTDVWNNESEAGWGVHLSHQGDTLFGIWYTYDSTGRDQWLSAVASTTDGGQSFIGELRQITGTVYSSINNAQAFTSAPVVGSVRFDFSNGTTASMRYSIGAITQTKALKRYVFGTPVTICR